MRRGFTLIEMSIVLVIIGLVIGGMLVGQDLIRAAAVRNQIKQFHEYEMAFNTFVTKYNCIPGDCANATQLLGSADSLGNTVINGNGNGQIDTGTGTGYDGGQSWSGSPEMYGAFQELAMSRLSPFVPSILTSNVVNVSHPSVALNPNAGFFFGASYNFKIANGSRTPSTTAYQTGSNALWFVDCASQAGGDVMGFWDDGCGIFTPPDLQAIDIKIDDGKPLSGRVFGFGGYNSPPYNVNCLNGSGITATYNTSLKTPQCQAAYVIN